MFMPIVKPTEEDLLTVDHGAHVTIGNAGPEAGVPWQSTRFNTLLNTFKF